MLGNDRNIYLVMVLLCQFLEVFQEISCRLALIELYSFGASYGAPRLQEVRHHQLSPISRCPLMQ